ncbi:hypothetical protein D9M68_693110 [compost metagenome]
MRIPLLFTAVLALGGCAWLPAHDPSQAWIDLYSREPSELLAAKVDGKPLDDPRFFQVSPGAHELQAHLHFSVDASNIGANSQPLPRDCQVLLKYADFSAGQRYRLEAGNIGFRAWSKLYDAQNRLLARGREGRCGEL